MSDFRKGFVIYDQLRKMGASVDWDRAVFMMDPVIFKQLIKVIQHF
jgi:valyl-tRNA synthetase